MDVQDPEAMAWRAAERLPGTSWLNLLGTTAAATGLDLDELAAHAWRHDTAVLRLKHGALLRAGALPRRPRPRADPDPWI